MPNFFCTEYPQGICFAISVIEDFYFYKNYVYSYLYFLINDSMST